MPTMTPTERTHVLATLNDEQRKAVRELLLAFQESVHEMYLDLDDLFVPVENR